MAQKKSVRKPKNTGGASGFHSIFSRQTTDFLLGFILLCLSVCLIIAMVSYFNTGAADQSILEDLRPGDWMNKEKQLSNYDGGVGAIISYVLIDRNFGFAAFLIPTFLILVSLRLMGAYRKLNLWKWFFGMTVVMIWSSVTMAKFLTPLCGKLVFNPGGDHGLYVVQRLEAMIGPPGLTAILLIVAVVFLTVLSTETITVIRKALNPVGLLTSKIKFVVTNRTGETADTVMPEPEPTEDDSPLEEADHNDEPGPTVIDLTEDPGRKPAPPTPAGKTENIEVTNGNLTVEKPHDEEKAKGKNLAIEELKKTPINPKEPFTNYKYPTLSLLKHYDDDGKPEVDMDEIKANNARIVEVLNSFGVQIREIKATVGPTITLYEITPAEGVRISKIRNLGDDIALSLSALGIRIIAPMPGKGTIGIEVPNKKKNIVSMESVLNSRKFQETTMDLPIALGKTITNEVFMVDLAKIPHLLVAGATGQGKSVGLNAIITSLLYKKHPNELKIILIDPKKVEFSVYSKIADHFMAGVEDNLDEPIITDVKKVVKTLNSLCTLMDHRYDLLKIAGARNIKEYNRKYLNHLLNPEDGHDFMPYIVVIIDEYGDLIMTAGKEIELPITRIAQLARAVGIHMVIATQRPTTNIITGSIKANFPGRIAFRVGSIIDSRTILDRPGANQLVGRGDMLYLNGGEPVRVQCAFIDTPEIERINEYIAQQSGPVEPLVLPEPANEDVADDSTSGGSISHIDPLFRKAAQIIVYSDSGSTSRLQRELEIGYNRAGRLMDQLQKAGIVGPAQGAKPRDVLVKDENTLNTILTTLGA